jgi:hypothetical protein
MFDRTTRSWRKRRRIGANSLKKFLRTFYDHSWDSLALA